MKHLFLSFLFCFFGAGLREKYFIDLYVGGLYVKTKSSDAGKLISADEPMAMRLKIVSGMVTSEKMAETVKEGFQKSMNGNTKPLQKEIDQFIKAFSTFKMKVGDQCDLVYIPNEGLHMIINEKEMILVKGIEFKKALFGIWLGTNPADEDFKASILKL